MPDYSSMSDEQYRDLMRQQALASQQPGVGYASDPSQTLPPITEGTVQRWQAAEAPQLASATPTPQTQGQAPVIAQNQPQPNTGLPGGGFNFDRLARLSNANTATTLQAMNRNQEELYKAQDDKAAAIRREAELQSKTDADIAAYNQQSLDQQALLQAQHQQKELALQQGRQQQMDKYESIKDSFLNSKIDPDNAWRHGLFGDHMTANKVVAAIGLALAGFGGARAVAQASHQINTAIDRDVAIQSAAIAKMGRAADMQSNMVGMYRQAYQDQVQADLAAKMALQEQAINTIEQRKRMAKSESDLNMADQLTAQLKMDFADTQNKFLQASNAVVTQGIMQQANLENLKGEQEYRRGVLGINALKAASAGAGQKIPAEQVSKLADLQTAIQNVRQLQSNFNSNTSGMSGKVASVPFVGEALASATATDAQKYTAARRVVKQLVGKALEGGILRPEDEKKYDQMFPEAGTWNAKAQVMFSTLLGTLQNSLGQHVQSLQQTGYNTGGVGAGASVAAPETRSVGGKTYQKVPGGWQLVQ